jgi:putative acyl-CoA dehydrogenase
MTFASVPVLRDAEPAIRDLWLPRLLARHYDPRPLPVSAKQAALVGMGMTERQGGSDVRSNRTQATRCTDGSTTLRGHKWFFSAPQCDAHLTLAQEKEGLTCYLLPHFLEDGSRNAVRINRLKDKLGNRSNASAEVEFDDALAWPVGAPGRGIPTILKMVQHTRLDCVLGSAGIMRAAVARALHHARHRVVFGQRLADTPLMRNVLADLALESEAATVLALRLARAFEGGAGPAETALARVLTPAAKYWICKRGPALAAEAMEVLGGNGYVEESALPRLYREMPVNSIWEGSGNVMCIDVVRAVRREPAAIEALLAELRSAGSAHAAFAQRLRELESMLAGASEDTGQGRRLAQLIVTLMQGSLLLRHAPDAVAEAFCTSRLDLAAFAGGAFGTLPAAMASTAILERALPEQ